MARNGGWQYRVPKCERCGRMGAMWSVYSDRNVCPSCLSLERAAYELAEAQKLAQQQTEAIADRAELEAILQAEYRDAAETERSLREGLRQF